MKRNASRANTNWRLRGLWPMAAGILIILAGVLTGVRPVLAQASAKTAPLDLSAYTAELKHYASVLAGLRQNPAGIPDFRKSLPAEWDVRAGGRIFRVSTAWLDSALGKIKTGSAAPAAQWGEIDRHLDFLRAQAEALQVPAATPSTTEARNNLDAIFQRREFRGMAGPGPFTRLWRRFVDWIGLGIDWVLARLHIGRLSGNLVAYGLIGIALLFLLYWGWRSIAGRSRESQIPPAEGRESSDRRKWAADALAAAERGEFREAIRCAYWAAVNRLEEQGSIPPNRSRTPRELLRSVAPGSAAREPFHELTQRFELVWYGYRPPSSADWQNTKTQLERMGCLGSSTPQTAGY